MVPTLCDACYRYYPPVPHPSAIQAWVEWLADHVLMPFIERTNERLDALEGMAKRKPGMESKEFGFWIHCPECDNEVLVLPEDRAATCPACDHAWEVVPMWCCRYSRRLESGEVARVEELTLFDYTPEDVEAYVREVESRQDFVEWRTKPYREE